MTPVTLSIPLWRRIRNSGDDPTTVFGDSPPHPSSCLLFSRACFRIVSLSLSHVSSPSSLIPLPSPFVLSPFFSFPSLCSFFLCYSNSSTSSFLSLSASLYIKHLTFPWYALLANNPPTPSCPTHSFFVLFPVSVEPSREGRSFLRIYTCWTCSLAPFRSHPYSFADRSIVLCVNRRGFFGFHRCTSRLNAQISFRVSLSFLL